MAKHTCAICGAEVNLMTGQKLADGNYICRKTCAKKCFKIMDLVQANLEDVTEHIAQIEKGTKIWNEVLVPLKKAKSKEEKLKYFGSAPYLYVSPSTGLTALVEARYKFFIFGKYEMACVYRTGDLARYDHNEESVKNSEGKMETKHFCGLVFENTTGLSAVNLPVSGKKECEEIEKCFNELFGIQKTLRNSFNNAKRQLDAIKSVAGAIKSAAQGNLDEAAAAQAMSDVDAYVRGDRTEMLAKADEILAKYN